MSLIVSTMIHEKSDRSFALVVFGMLTLAILIVGFAAFFGVVDPTAGAEIVGP